MELLEDVTYPRPLVDLLDRRTPCTARAIRGSDDYEVAPKSVVRDMYERAMTFGEFVSFYGLPRSEGLVLRYLADAYRALRQTVPEDAKTDELTDLIEWLGELVRQVDSSLIDEWERLRNPTDEPLRRRRAAARGDPQRTGVPGPGPQRTVPPGRAGRPAPLRRAGRTRRATPAGTPTRGRTRSRTTSTSTKTLGVGSDARGPALVAITIGPDTWTVRQTFDDPAGDHDWGISAEIDLAASDEAGVAVLRTSASGR